MVSTPPIPHGWKARDAWYMHLESYLPLGCEAVGGEGAWLLLAASA